MPIPEGQEPYWCLWCGTSDIPDHRLHLTTCSQACANAIMHDDLKRAREAGKKIGKGWRKVRKAQQIREAAG